MPKLMMGVIRPESKFPIPRWHKSAYSEMTFTANGTTKLCHMPELLFLNRVLAVQNRAAAQLITRAADPAVPSRSSASIALRVRNLVGSIPCSAPSHPQRTGADLRIRTADAGFARWVETAAGESCGDLECPRDRRQEVQERQGRHAARS